MAIGRLPIQRAVVVAYQDALHAVQVLRGLFLLALLIALFARVVGGFLPHDLTGVVVGIPLGAVRAVLLTPILVGVQRFILLGEASDRYAIEARNPRFFRFLLWSLALGLVLGGPALLWLTLSLLLGLPVTIDFIGLPISLIAGVMVALRLTVLFPAIAVDAPGATASNSIADTRGFTLDIFVIYLFALLPILATEWILHRLNLPVVVDTALGVIVEVATLALFVVISSRIFQALADRTLLRAST